MSFGKMNKFIEIKSIQNVKDEDGFSTKQEITVARVRGSREGRHGSKKWANRPTFTEATDLFIIRAIPGTKLSTDMTILCDDENFEITSIEIPKTADGIKNIVRAFKMKEKITLPEGAASSLYPKGKMIKIGR